MTVLQQLKAWNACSDGYPWAKEANCETLADVWDRLERPDRMIWCISKAGLAENLKREALVEWACQCAERVLPLYEKRHPKNDAPQKCIETTRLYMQGKATMDDLVLARRNAYAAHAYAAASAAAAYADAAAAYADYAAYAAAEAAAATVQEQKWQADKLRELCGNPFEVKP